MSQPSTSYEPYTPGRPGPERPWRPSDLVERPKDAGVERARSRRTSYAGAPDCLVVASAICVVIWAMSGFGYFWPIWVLLPTLLPTLLRRRGSRPGGSRC